MESAWHEKRLNAYLSWLDADDTLQPKRVPIRKVGGHCSISEMRRRTPRADSLIDSANPGTKIQERCTRLGG